jgi:hypothetical protein
MLVPVDHPLLLTYIDEAMDLFLCDAGSPQFPEQVLDAS